MADPRTREELVKEIENTASENENYKGFKDALAELNQKIDELMKPGKEGWKLLDEETFVPLYDNYLKTAKKLRRRTNWNVCSILSRRICLLSPLL